MSTFDFAGSTLLEVPGDATLAEATRMKRGLNLIQLHDDLWRVTRTDGDMLGYVEGFDDPRGRRFRSKRLNALKRQFLVLGEFWSFDDAIDCLRFG